MLWKTTKSVVIQVPILSLALAAGSFGQSAVLSSLQTDNVKNPSLSDPVAALREGNPYDRQRAAITLGNSGGAKAVEPLIKALRDEDKFVRNFAARALGNIGDSRAVTPLIEALDDESVLVRRTAAAALGRLKDARAFAPLVKALDSEDFMVQRSAALALGDLGDARAVDPLINRIGAGDEYTQSSIAAALVNIGEPAVPKLVNRLGDSRLSSGAAEILAELKWQPSSDEERVLFEAAKKNAQK